MKLPLMQMLLLCLTLSITTVQAGEADNAKSSARTAYINKLIGKLAAEDQAQRDAAMKRLSEILGAARQQLESVLETTRDAEQQVRIKQLLKIFPPKRKSLTASEIEKTNDIETASKTIKQLYAEYIVEVKRVEDELRTNDTSPPSNVPSILRDINKLLPRALNQIFDLPAVTIRLSTGAQIDVTPKMVLGKCLPLKMRDDYTETLRNRAKAHLNRLQPIEALLSSDRPPDAGDWETLRRTLSGTMINLRAESGDDTGLVSMIFVNASLLDVLNTICIQCDEFLFFDPPELSTKLTDVTTTCRLENIAWKSALTEVLTPLGLTYRYDLADEPGIHIMKKEK